MNNEFRVGFGTQNKIILRFWKPFWPRDVTQIVTLEDEEEEKEFAIRGSFDVMTYYPTGEKYLLVSEILKLETKYI